MGADLDGGIVISPCINLLCSLKVVIPASLLMHLPQTFMDTFNEIARAAHSNDDQFYSQV